VDRHSRLSGSHDLDIWAKSGADSVREAYKEHLMGPIIAVKDELFKTFRHDVFMLSIFHLLSRPFDTTKHTNMLSLVAAAC